jgi:hypothetical protein
MLACVGLYKQEKHHLLTNLVVAPKVKVSIYATSQIFVIVAGFIT